MIEWLSEVFAKDAFYLPFASTVSAALVLLLLQFIARIVTEQRKKLYAVAYTLDSCFRALNSSAIILRHTVNPHIEAAKRILEGEHELLQKMFLSGDFDILTDDTPHFDHLTTDTKVLLGGDDVELVQLADTLNNLCANDRKERALNSFVAQNLGDFHVFASLEESRRNAIVAAYWDHLEGIRINLERLIAFIAHIIAPRFVKYSKSWQFWCFARGSIRTAKQRLASSQEINSDLIPNSEFFFERVQSGIQRAL